MKYIKSISLLEEVLRSAALNFISLSFVKIISLYLLIYMKDKSSMRFAVANTFILTFIIGYAVTHFLSQQIQSAHQSHQFIY